MRARSAIGDSGEEQRLIKTLPRKGFRFVGTVREAQGRGSRSRSPTSPKNLRNPPLRFPTSPRSLCCHSRTSELRPGTGVFRDGIAEDVLTTLSKIQELLVIARNSSFVFKGQARDIREIGRILGARYVLEGSVRKAGNRVRLAAQLIDSLNGSHVWADRFEGDLDDVFELQDRITQDIVAALEVQLDVWRRGRGCGANALAARWCTSISSRVEPSTSTLPSTLMHKRAANSNGPWRSTLLYTPALAMLGFALTDQARFGWEKDQAATYEAALECAARALAVDPDSDEAYVAIGYTRLFQRRHDDALAAGEKAIALCPNSAGAYHMAGMFHGYAGDFRKAAEYEEQSQRLSPLSRNERGGRGAGEVSPRRSCCCT